MINKKKQITKPAPIVYSINNINPNITFVTLAFAKAGLSSTIEISSFFEWIKTLDLFTYNEFEMLRIRAIDPRNKQVGMNQKHLAIWYAVLFLSDKIYTSDIEYDLLSYNDGVLLNEKHAEARSAYLVFSKRSLKEIREDYKLNYNFEATMAKINEFGESSL